MACRVMEREKELRRDESYCWGGGLLRDESYAGTRGNLQTPGLHKKKVYKPEVYKPEVYKHKKKVYKPKVYTNTSPHNTSITPLHLLLPILFYGIQYQIFSGIKLQIDYGMSNTHFLIRQKVIRQQ